MSDIVVELTSEATIETTIQTGGTIEAEITATGPQGPPGPPVNPEDIPVLTNLEIEALLT